MRIKAQNISMTIDLPKGRTGHIYVDHEDVVHLDLVNVEGENIGYRMIKPEQFADLFRGAGPA